MKIAGGAVVEKTPLYQVNVDCLFCESKYPTSKVRPSFKKTSKTDTDFCIHYKEFNPDYYVVRVCPYCGFAHTENFAKTMDKNKRELFQERIAKRWVPRDYGGERGWSEALQTYQLALLCAQITVEKERVVAGLLHHIAWLHRYNDNEPQELRFLKFALNSYVKVFETEGGSLNNARLMYLIGELNRRVGSRNEAVKWFARVVNDKRVVDSAMIKACREQWTLVREELQTVKNEELATGAEAVQEQVQ
jgi:uncharacterized protein (DUF2225 family)